MGETSETYYDGLMKALKDAMDEFDGTVAPAHVYYQKILQDNENTVWERMKGEGLNYKDLRKFLLYGFADAAGLETRKEDPESPYALAQVDVARQLLQLYSKLPASGPVVVIAQSLGGQVFSSYLYDAQKLNAGGMPTAGIWTDIQRYSALIKDDGEDLTAAEIAFLSGRNIVGLLTTGCNIPLFVAAHKEMHIIPIEKPSAQFDWLNLYDQDDVLGWPLGPLNNRYKALVVDRKINANGRGPIEYILGATPQSHTLYWDDKDVIIALRDMLREGIHKAVGAPANVEIDVGD
jgi:hypothetical protein